MKYVLLTFALIAFVAFTATVVFRSVYFEQQCGGYLQRAANANTIDLAVSELTRALGHLERSSLTSGYTSILYRTPDEDLGYVYNNLKDSLAELRAIKPEATHLERSNVLMKLRETLLDQGKNGQHLALPKGISRYPHNGLFTVWGWGAALLTLGTGIVTPAGRRWVAELFD